MIFEEQIKVRSIKLYSLGLQMYVFIIILKYMY
jgi:hypothetical protein